MPRDLFDIFPDLPRPRRRSFLSERHKVNDVRLRAAMARARMLTGIAERHRIAAAVRQGWQRQTASPGRGKR